MIRPAPILILLSLLLPTALPALTLDLPADGEDLVGTLKHATTRYEDTFSDLARANDLGYNEMLAANPDVDPWLPGAGTRVVIPTRFILPPGPREGIVINLAELRLYYYPPDSGKVVTYPLGIGREGWSTPEGRSRIRRKQKNPSWRPPKSIRAEAAREGRPLPRVVPPGPDNPLGSHALYLDIPGYLIHGTNKPYGVGMRVSHGCIRLYPEDIRKLYAEVPVGTPVRIINQPYKAGWAGGRLYIEAHAPLSEQRKRNGNTLTPMVRTVLKALEKRSGSSAKVSPDWESLQQAARLNFGIPVAVAVDSSAPVATAPLRSPQRGPILPSRLEKSSGR